MKYSSSINEDIGPRKGQTIEQLAKLADTIAGLIAPTSGSITIAGAMTVAETIGLDLITTTEQVAAAIIATICAAPSRSR